MIVVTGGNGFIGSHVVRWLRDRDADIVIIENYKTAFQATNGKVTEVDWTMAETFLAQNSEVITKVIHMGALTSTTQPHTQELRLMNTQFTMMLWRWCAEHHVPFVYASSASTYGDGDQGFHDIRDTKDLLALNPRSPYAQSKHDADVRINALTLPPTSYMAFPWYSLKFFNVYGPGEAHKGDQRSVISKWRDAAKAEKPIEVFENTLDAARDYIFVSDVVDVIMWCLEEQPMSGIYNVGSGAARTFSDVIAVMVETYGTLQVKRVRMPILVENQYQYLTRADIRKLRAEGYSEPFLTLEEGLKEYDKMEQGA